jgi:hypothetical protein
MRRNELHSENREEKEPLGVLKRRVEDNIKMELRK